MLIDLYANDGSPIGVIPPDIYDRGVGGAELAMMTWAQTMVEHGHQVRIYNTPRQIGDYDGVEYLPQSAFRPNDSRDVFIVYRSPNPFIRAAKAGMKIHWSCDQYTIGYYETDIFPYVDKIVCISPYHVDYHKRTYNASDDKIGHIDLGVRVEDYDQYDVDKVPGRCIFCSVPSRGLDELRQVWPQIKERVPHASLVITSDWRLWGVPNAGDQEYRMRWVGQDDISYVGKIPRSELVQEQLKAQVQSYPCTYEELFCISTAECQIAGAYPVTSNMGALRTTNQWGTIIEGNPQDSQWQERFIENVVAALQSDLSTDTMDELQEQARQRFDWHKICERWERLIKNGDFDAAL